MPLPFHSSISTWRSWSGYLPGHKFPPGFLQEIRVVSVHVFKNIKTYFSHCTIVLRSCTNLSSVDDKGKIASSRMFIFFSLFLGSP